MRIVFMGTPDFAVPCLQALLDKGHDVCAVYTQPDKPVGRKQILTPPPVKTLALEHGIPVYQPTTFRDEETVKTLSSLQPELIAVVAYGKLLPKSVLDIPPYGCINVHGSLLPKYRGAAPIQWAVLNGDKVTGVTTMYMGEGLDTGDMLDKAETSIDPDETSGELFDRLSLLGAQLLLQTVDALQKGDVHRTVQDEALATHTKKIDKSLCPIDWNGTAQHIHDQVRGLSPWPTATTTFRGKTLKIHKTARCGEAFSGTAGTILVQNGRYFVLCGEGALELLEVQYAGSKRMSAGDFFRGHPVTPGETLEASV
ncbi:MAG: methionyl-tRNA formyltransferase [Oscillospiraceae bacterium]|nr:methionyl-tRNA formyltransferase [Oscillospiraceae bacterium]